MHIKPLGIGFDSSNRDDEHLKPDPNTNDDGAGQPPTDRSASALTS